MSNLLEMIQEFKSEFSSKVPQEVKETMMKATQDLESLKISEGALKVGTTVSDFKLPNATNIQVSLFDALEKSEYVVLNFYRGVWCPYCNLEVQALKGIQGELDKLNAKIVAISPESPDLSLSIKEKNELSFEVLSDAQNRIAKQYGLVFSLAEELRPIYKSFGIDIVIANKDESYELPMPATYVINKNKEIIFSFVDEDYTKRCEPQEILNIIKSQ